MSTVRNLTSWTLALTLMFMMTAGTHAQQSGSGSPAVAKVEVKAPATEAEVGKPLQFTATALDASGNPIAGLKPTAWFAAPFDLAAAEEGGTINFYNPGEVKVGAIVGGKLGFTTINVKS